MVKIILEILIYLMPILVIVAFALIVLGSYSDKKLGIDSKTIPEFIRNLCTFGTLYSMIMLFLMYLAFLMPKGTGSYFGASNDEAGYFVLNLLYYLLILVATFFIRRLCFIGIYIYGGLILVDILTIIIGSSLEKDMDPWMIGTKMLFYVITIWILIKDLKKRSHKVARASCKKTSTAQSQCSKINFMSDADFL